MNSAANKILSYTIEHGGGTFRMDYQHEGEPIEVAQGYAVAAVPGTWETVPTDNLEDFDDVIDRFQDTFHDRMIGTWVDDNHISVDPIMIFVTRSLAIKVAKRFGQKAIYDFATKETIDVTD